MDTRMTEATARPQPRRRAAVAAALLAGLLAACGTVVPRGSPPPKAPPPPPRSAPAPSSQALPPDVARQRVALLVPLTGRNAAVGRSIADAATLAILDTRDTRLRVTTYDTGDTSAATAAAAQKAIAEGNGLFLGPLLADDVRAVAAPAAAAGVPVIAFSNDAAVAGPDVWLLGFQPGQSVDRVVRYARERGVSRFCGLTPQGGYGRTVATALIHAAEDAGGSVAAMQGYDRTPRGLRAAVTQLARQKCDAVLIAEAGTGAIAAAQLVRAAEGPGTRLLGTELWAASPGLASAPALAGAWYASVDGRMFDQLGQRFAARYGRRPYRLASLGYDAVLLTIRIAGDWKPGRPFPTDRLGAADGFAGVDGAFRFGRDHVAERALAVHQLGGGTVSPAPRGF